MPHLQQRNMQWLKDASQNIFFRINHRIATLKADYNKVDFQNISQMWMSHSNLIS